MEFWDFGSYLLRTAFFRKVNNSVVMGRGLCCRSFAVFVTNYYFWFDFRFVSVSDVFVPTDDGSKSKVKVY